MKIKNKKIILKSDLKIEEVETRIIKGIDNRGYHSLSDSIMTGTLKNGKIKAVINPFGAFSDPFKARVEGEIISHNEGTKIELEIKLGLISIFSIFFWFIPVISLMQHESNQNIVDFIRLLSFVAPFILLTFLLLILKMNSDKKRLKKWLVKQLNL